MVHLSTHARPGPPRRGIRRRTVGAMLALGLAAAGVSAVSPSASASGDRQLTVAIVGNPQMEDIAALTPELFTAETGIKVNYTVLEEGTLREVVTRDVGAGGRAVRRRDDRHVRGATIRRQRLAGRPHAIRRGRRGVQHRRPDPVGAVGPQRRRRAVRLAVLRRVVVPDVPPGRDGRGRHRDAGEPDLGRGRRDRPPGRLRRDGRHLPPWQARMGRPRCVVHYRAQHVRRHVVVGERRRIDRRGADRPA